MIIFCGVSTIDAGKTRKADGSEETGLRLLENLEPSDQTERVRQQVMQTMPGDAEKMVEITRHAINRIRKRVGLPKRIIKDHVQKVWSLGAAHKDTKGNLRRFITKKYRVNTEANNIKIYGTFIYILCGKTLITVLDAPPSLRRQTKKATAKKKKSRWTQKHSRKS